MHAAELPLAMSDLQKAGLSGRETENPGLFRGYGIEVFNGSESLGTFYNSYDVRRLALSHIRSNGSY